MINFHQLRIFYHVAKNLSFSEAARDLFITQPAVTNQVKALEDSWNVKLFYKKRNRVFITNEGKALFNYAKKVFEYEKEIEIAISDIHSLKTGVLRLGVTKTMVPSFMHFLVKRFEDDYPGLLLQVNEGSSLEIMYSLINYTNDVAIVAKVEDHPDVRFVHFTREKLCLLLQPDHHLAKRKSIYFDELCKEPVIMKEVGSATRKIVNELFQKNNRVPNVLLETSNTEFIKQLVQRGEGISFMAKPAVLSELKNGKLVTIRIRDQEAFIDVYIAYVKDYPLAPPVSAFFQLIGELPVKYVIPTIVPSFQNSLLVTDLAISNRLRLGSESRR